MDLDSFVTVESVDPAADFIAREQNVLAELEGEIDFTDDLTNSSQDLNAGSQTIIAYENMDINNLSTDANNNPFATVNETKLMEETSGVVEETEETKDQGNVSFGEPMREHEKITRWRAGSVKMLTEKDEQEANKKRELAEQAKQELDEWYAQYNDQLNRCKTANRQAEADWITERDAEIRGKEWEKVARMCDFNPKPNLKNTRDTSRMRSLLLQLKQNPPIESTPSS